MSTAWTGYRIDPHKHPLDFAKCGTPGNYRAHLRRGEPACGACKQAEARRSQDRDVPHSVRKKRRENRVWLDQFNQMLEDAHRRINVDQRRP